MVHDAIDMSLAEKIKEAMRLAGISSEKRLAELSGVSYGTIHNYMQSRREPSFYKIMKIAKACRQDITFFVEEMT